MIKKIAILGAGNGGCTFSGHLSMRGFEVGLYEDPKFEKNIKGIKEKGGVELTGALEGFGKFFNATTDIKDVITGADIVMVAVPAFAHKIMIEAALPYLEEGQIVVFNPGNFGSLVFRDIMKSNGIKKDIKVADTASLMYSTRRIGPGKVKIDAVKKVMPIAALPNKDTAYVVSTLKEIFSEFTPAKNVIEVGFENINMIIHCAAAVLNAGRIEDTKGDFMFYWEGMTESVCRVMEKMDEERINVGEKMGLKLPPTLYFLRKYYPSDKKGIDLHDWLTHSKVEGGQGPDAPKNLHNRYISEDVPNGLVPVSIFGKLVRVPTPTIDSIITLSSVMNEENYFDIGRTFERMGLSDLSCKEILNYIEKGLTV